MIREDKNIDQIFSKKLSGFEKTPPAFIWDNLQVELINRKRKRKLLVWRLSGVAAALFIAFVTGWQINDYLTNDTTTIVKNIPQTEQQVQIANSAKHEAIETDRSVLTEETTASSIFIPEKENLGEKHLTAENGTYLSSGKVNNRQKPMSIIKAMKAILNTPPVGAQDLAKKNAAEESTLSADDFIIMERNRALLAMNEAVDDQQRWSVGASVSPVFTVTQTEQDRNYAKRMANPDGNSSVNVGGGLSVEYKLKKKWSFQSGVYYSKLDQSSSNSRSNSRADYFMANSKALNVANYFSTPVTEKDGALAMNTVVGVVQIKSLPPGVALDANLGQQEYNAISGNAKNSTVMVADADFSQNFEYIEVPLYMKYQLLDSKIGVQLMGGFSTNILVGNNAYMKGDDGKHKIGKTVGMSDFNYSGLLGVGLKYSLTPNLYLNVEPRFKYYLNSLNKDRDVSYKPYSFGLFTGVSYSF